MLTIQKEGIKAIIDARELVNKGVHPREPIIEFVKQAKPSSSTKSNPATTTASSY